MPVLFTRNRESRGRKGIGNLFSVFLDFAFVFLGHTICMEWSSNPILKICFLGLFFIYV